MRLPDWSSLLGAAVGLALLACSTSDDLIATPTATGGSPEQQVVSPCALVAGATPALSRYDFEDAEGATTLRDSRGLADARIEGGAFASTLGPAGCGKALFFGMNRLFAVIPNLPGWDLDEGSVDFWFRVPSVSGTYGILGRDHTGTDLPGHFSVWLNAERTVTLRLQGAGAVATLCSAEPLSVGQWVHVGFNFGALGSELWVDRKLASRTGDPRVATIVPDCGGTTYDGIAGNEQPWVLGFDTSRSGDMLDGLLHHFDEGAIDALQISAERRNFQDP